MKKFLFILLFSLPFLTLAQTNPADSSVLSTIDTKIANRVLKPAGIKAVDLRETLKEILDFVNLKNPVLTPEMFGAVGDGVTDDKAAFQKMFNLQKDIHVLAQNKYYISGRLTRSTTYNTTIDGGGTGVFYGNQAQDIFRFEPTTINTITIDSIGGSVNYPTVSSVNLSTPIYVSSTSGYSKGDVILISSNNTYTHTPTAQKGELVRILEIADGQKMYLHGVISDSYTTQPKLTKLENGKICLTNFSVTQSTNPYTESTGNYIGSIRIIGAVSPDIKNVKFYNLTSASVNLTTVWGANVDINCKNIRDKVGSNMYGYGVQCYGASRYSRVNIIAERVRHAYTGEVYAVQPNVLYKGTVRESIVSGTAINCTAASFDTHPGEYDATFINCFVYRNGQDADATTSQTSAYQDRGINTRFINCFSDNHGVGLYLATGTANNGTDSKGLIKNCRFNGIYGITNSNVISTTANTSGYSVTYIFENSDFEGGIFSIANSSPVLNFYDCIFREIRTLRLGTGNVVRMLNCRRINTNTFVEGILLDSGSSLEIDNYYASAPSFSNTSLVRTTGTTGTATVIAGRLSSAPKLSNPITSNGTVSLVVNSLSSYADGNIGSKTYDPPSIAAGTEVTTTVTATGAALGQFARAAFSLDLAGIRTSAYVSATNTVTVVLRNNTASPIDLASGTLSVKVD